MSGFILETHTPGLKQQHQFSMEERESLRMLLNSEYWKVYKRVLAIQRQGYLASLLATDEPSKSLKSAGIVVGIDLALNQLGILVDQFDKQAKRVEEESKNPTQP